MESLSAITGIPSLSWFEELLHGYDGDMPQRRVIISVVIANERTLLIVAIFTKAGRAIEHRLLCRLEAIKRARWRAEYHGCSRPTDEVGRLVQLAALGADPAAPAA
jgi:hypothetical protein